MLTRMGGGGILCDLGCLHAFHTEPVCALSHPSKVELDPDSKILLKARRLTKVFDQN